MAETPAEVRRDIELTRERMSSTLDQLEQKLNVQQLVRENPWPAIGLAVAAGFILSGSRADVRAAAATVAATRGASSRLGPVLDDLVSQVVQNVSQGFEARVNGWVDEIRGAIGTSGQQGQGGQRFYGDREVGGMGAQQGYGVQGTGRFADTSRNNDMGNAGYASSGGHGVAQSPSGHAGIGGTDAAAGYGTGPTHSGPTSFGNAAAGPNPTGPGTSGSTGFGGATGTGPNGNA